MQSTEPQQSVEHESGAFRPSTLAMTRRVKRRDRCPARLALGCPEVPDPAWLDAGPSVGCWV